jgi:hypothetical protein
MKIATVRQLSLAALIVLPFAAHATGTCTNEPKAKWMKEGDVTAQFEKEGYQVKRIKAEGTCYEVYALDKNAKRHEMVVNPIDGKPVKEEANE